MFEIIKNNFIKELWSSPYRIIKFCIICIIPFLYGFFLIFAFWNPISNLDKVPTAIVNTDSNHCFKIAKPDTENLIPNIDTENDINSEKACKDLNTDKQNNDYTYVWGSITDNIFQSMITNPDNNNIHIKKPDSEFNFNIKYINKPGEKYTYEKYSHYWGKFVTPTDYSNTLLSLYKSYRQYIGVLTNAKSSTDQILCANYVLENCLSRLHGGVISQSDYNRIIDKQPKPDNVISFFGPQAGDYSESQLKFYGSYEHNFIVAQIFYVFQGLSASIVDKIVPDIILDGIEQSISLTPEEIQTLGLTKDQSYVSSIKFDNLVADLKTTNETLKELVKKIKDDNIKMFIYQVISTLNYFQDKVTNFEDEIFANPIPVPNPPNPKLKVILREDFNDRFEDYVIRDLLNFNLNDIVQSVNSDQYSNYGVGIGQLFIAIGLWVGVFMQTFLYERDNQLKKFRKKYYFAKLFNFLTTTVIQTTVLALSLLLIGYTTFGTMFIFYYLWLLFSAMIFTIIIYNIWYIPKEVDVSRFIMVIYLIINLSSGWGTFPSVMQISLFNVLSYIAPFRYCIHGQGIIIYGIGINGYDNFYNLEIIKWLFCLITFALLFSVIGYISSRNRMLKANYGAARKKILARALTNIGAENLIKKNTWNNLTIATRLQLEKLSEEQVNELNLKTQEIINNRKKTKGDKNGIKK